MEQSYLRELASDTEYFGYYLAGLVADKLDEGHSLGYSHRDYCGMGLEKNDKGEYLYGELYDGGMMIPSKFTNRESFVEWLAFQSTASLARLNDKEEFYRGNQTLTRQRLEQFIGQSFGKF
ncbi:hypothetical protein [Chitinophaga barathri]|uniref:hypothetical protein n=1 Tax=Chitinophaga barathri TaxID=1647451 RepID=UPI000F4E5147|nr:hypothetical protein [Chitinophaga barathri]